MTVQSRSSPLNADETMALRAILEIRPDAHLSCPVLEEGPEVSGVTQNTVERGGRTSCQSQVTVIDGTTPRGTYHSTTVSSSCVCTILDGFECAYDIEGVRDGAFHVSIVIPRRALLEEIIADLRSIDAHVTLRRICSLNDDVAGTIEVDATAVTDKQREAVELAIELGYYDDPRRASLDDLADRLGISKSAVSQRLNSVESTLVRSLSPSS